MIRRLFTITSALSLLLCATTVVLWLRSYIAPAVVSYECFSHFVTAALGSGKLHLFDMRIMEYDLPKPGARVAADHDRRNRICGPPG